MLPLAAGAAVTLGSLATSALGQATWIGGPSASAPAFNFSTPANWQGNAAPTSPSDLTFYSGNGAAVTATNNINAAWSSTNLTFNVNNVNGLTVAGGALNSTFTLTGAGASLFSNGLGNAILSNNAAAPTGAQLQLDSDVTFGGTGIGNLTLSAASSATGIAVSQTSAHSITVSPQPIVSGQPLPAVLRNLVLGGGGNTFTGGVILDGGTLQLSSASGAGAFGTTAGNNSLTVTANGGAVNATGTPALSLGTLQLNGDLHVIGTGVFQLSNTTVTAPGVVQGSGTLYVHGLTTSGAGMQIASYSPGDAGAQTGFYGAVVIDQSKMPMGILSEAGALTLVTQAFGPGTNNLPNIDKMGSLTGAASYDVRAGGSIVLTNSTTNSKQNNDRISDTAPMRLRSGKFTLSGPAAATTTGTTANNYTPANLTEKIGDLTVAGQSILQVTGPGANNSVITTLQPNSLTRVENGTFLIRNDLGAMGNGNSPKRGRVILTNPLPSTQFIGGGGQSDLTTTPATPTYVQNVSILPWAVGSPLSTSASALGNTLVTYDNGNTNGDGFRMLAAPSSTSDNTREYYITDVAPADPTANVYLMVNPSNPPSGAFPNNGAQSMNSLVLAGDPSGIAGTCGSVTGTGTLTITSGVILATFNPASTPTIPAASIENDLQFNGQEAVIYSNAAGGVWFKGKLHGTGGLTKAGNGSSGFNGLVLTADNSDLHGTLTLNGGTLAYNTDLSLPGDGTIVVNGAGLQSGAGNQIGTGLYWGGGSPTTLSRDIHVNTGMLSFGISDGTGGSTSTTALGNLTVASQISGVGSVSYAGQNLATIPTGGQVYVTNTSNTYTGTTRFSTGNIHISADGSTGVGGGWELSSTTLTLEAPVTNSRHINIDSNSTIDTGGNTVELDGPITAFNTSGTFNANSGLKKLGSGTLNLTSLANQLGGTVEAQAGTLLVNGNLGPHATNSVIVDPGATLGGSGTIYRNVNVFSTVTGAGSNKGGGTLSPGNSPGILTVWGAPTATVSALNMAQPTTNPTNLPVTLSMQLNGPVAGTGYDQVRVFAQNASSVAAVNLGGSESPTPTTQQAALQLSLGYAPAANSAFWLITNTNNYLANLGAANTTVGTFAGLPEGSPVTLGTIGGVTYSGTISYKGDFENNNPAAGTGNDVVIYNVRGCGSADFNCDGDVGTDLDIEAFFACLAGSCPPAPCANSADFNGDGDLGTDADIEAFFRVLAGGSC
jgi:autotransporter-associated beta strand protein